MKKIIALFMISCLLLSLTACQNNTKPLPGDTENQEDDNTITASLTESASTESENTATEDIENKSPTTMVEIEGNIYEAALRPDVDVLFDINLPPADDSENTRLAISFVENFYKAVELCADQEKHWSEYIDIDKYYDEGYLKDFIISYLDNNTVEKDTHRGTKYLYQVVDTKAYDERQVGDITYITVICKSNWIYPIDLDEYAYWSGGGGREVIGIRNGRIVNQTLYGIDSFSVTAWKDEDFSAFNFDAYDIRDDINPWDNEEYSVKILELYGYEVKEH